jgi:MoxR-like ATPase
MEENHVTVDGATHELPDPFFVIATQNPQHQIGTYPLPESQLDRFLMRLEIGFPGRDAERELLSGPTHRGRLSWADTGLTGADLKEMQKAADEVFVSEPLREYLLDLLAESRRRAKTGTGLSPRAGLSLQRAARAWALMQGRDLVLPEDVQAVGPSVMAHRLAQVEWQDGLQGQAAAEALLRSVPVR